jgi:quinohemoprotein ethanol dehydrogenase
VAPDLRLMTSQTHDEYEDIVLGGSRAEKGMAGFDGVLSAENIETIRAFLVVQANQLREWQQGRQTTDEGDSENRG